MGSFVSTSKSGVNGTSLGLSGHGPQLTYLRELSQLRPDVAINLQSPAKITKEKEDGVCTLHAVVPVVLGVFAF
jgi:hypothetical protein